MTEDTKSQDPPRQKQGNLSSAELRKLFSHLVGLNLSGRIQAPAPIEAEGKGMFAAACELDLEGIVAKRKDSRYGAETIWYKIKNRSYSQMEGRWEKFKPRLAP